MVSKAPLVESIGREFAQRFQVPSCRFAWFVLTVTPVLRAVVFL